MAKVSNVFGGECKMCGLAKSLSTAENLRQWLGRCPSRARNEITLLTNTLSKNTFKNAISESTFSRNKILKNTFQKSPSLPLFSVGGQIGLNV